MAEIHQKIVMCPKGHYYDANMFNGCPTCSNGGFTAMPNIGMGGYAQSGSFGRTIAPNMGTPSGSSNNFGRTMAPNMEGSQSPSGNFGKTVAPNMGGMTVAPNLNVGSQSSRMGHTVAVDPAAPSGQPQPVVGWLVAISGSCKGRDYRIYSGNNYIGRERGDIVIDGDDSISSERDSSIAYEYRSKRFWLAHEFGKNILLLNGDPVMGGVRVLESFDVITVGNTELVFVALCGERFSWDGGVVGHA